MNAAIVNPKDDEELALTLNGKKKRITRTDFIQAAEAMGVESVTVERMISKYHKLLPAMVQMIGNSFISTEMQDRYSQLLHKRMESIMNK